MGLPPVKFSFPNCGNLPRTQVARRTRIFQMKNDVNLLRLFLKKPKNQNQMIQRHFILHLLFGRAAIIAASPSWRQRAQRKAKLTRLYRSTHGYSNIVDSAPEISLTIKTCAFHFELTSMRLYRTLLVLLIQAGDLVLDRII